MFDSLTDAIHYTSSLVRSYLVWWLEILSEPRTGVCSFVTGLLLSAVRAGDIDRQRRCTALSSKCEQWRVDRWRRRQNTGFILSGTVASLPGLGPRAPPSRTGPLARNYLPGFPYSWSSGRVRQKISSIYCTVICNYPSAAQEQPFTVDLFC